MLGPGRIDPGLASLKGPNLNLEFFEALFPKKEGILATAFIKGGKCKNLFFKLSEGFDTFFETCDNAVQAGYKCYFVPSVMKDKGRKKFNFKESNALWVDYDNPDQPLIIPPDIPQPSFKVESSPGKWHLYWLLDQPATSLQVETSNKALAERLHGDMACWDSTRLLRVPGTQNFKYSTPKPVGLVIPNGVTRRPLDKFPFPWGNPIPGLRQTFV